MYDYNSNVIWSNSIKSCDITDLIIGINACYKVLGEGNITSIIHCLNNKISNKIILLIKRKGLKH